MKEFLIREISETKGKFTVSRFRNNAGAAHITIAYKAAEDCPAQRIELAAKDTYEQDARDLLEALDTIASNPCTLPKVAP